MAKQPHQPFEATIQDLVYSVDAGLGLKIIRTMLFALFVLGLLTIYTAGQFRGLNSEAAMDYAQLGRNLAQTKQYLTQCVRPVSMAQVAAHSFDNDPAVMRHPEVFRAPLYPALLAAHFKLFDLLGVDLFPESAAFQGKYPAEQWVIIPLNHFFAVLSGLMLYLLGRKLFSHQIGLLGAWTYFLSEMVWADSLSATGFPLLVFLSLSTVYFALLAMIRRRDRRPLRAWIPFYLLAVLCSAAAFLTHYSALALFPGVALFIWLMGTKTQRSGHLVFFYLSLTLLLVFPWLLRNYQIAGAPLGLAPHTALIGSDAYPGDAFMRTLKPAFRLVPDFNLAKAKCVKQLAKLYTNGFTSMGGGLLISFFMTAFFYRFVRVPVHNLRWGIGLSMVLLFAGIGFFGPESLRLYHLFWPFVILYGLAFFTVLLDRLDFSLQLYKNAVTGLVIGLTALPLIITIFLAPAPGLTYPPYYPPFIMRVSELLKPSELLCTDMPWATAWYGRRTSLLLPQNIDDYFEINDYRKYISGLYFTTLTRDRSFVSSLLNGSEKTWFPVTLGRFPKEFPLKEGIPINGQDQVFMTDYARWNTDAAKKPAAGAKQ